MPAARKYAAIFWLLLPAALAFGHLAPCAVAASAAERILDLEALAKAGDWHQAAAAARQWAQDEPQEARAFYWLGIALWQQDHRIDSIQTLRKSELLGLTTVESHLTLGRAYYAIHQFALFRQQMAKASALAPIDAKPHFQLGRYFDSVVGDYRQALGHYRRAADLAPEDGETLYYVGFCQEMLGQRDAARAAYESSWRLLRARADAFSWPAQRMAQLLLYEDIESALRWARDAISAEPGQAVNHYVLAKVYLRMNQVEEAVDELLEANRLDPKDPSARYLLATAYAELGQAEQSRRARLDFQRLRTAYGAQ
jgi:Flp pilus assembly protein TadD